jgi:DNA-directed RNA polymerase alpha subunit
MKKQHPVISKPISELETSIAFREICGINGFTELADILRMPVHEIEKMTGINAHFLMEFMDIVKKYGVEKIIKEELD